ncbi:hypothetical protein BDZ91DRAFT_633433, partial [Kalaharituber pfeilii]
KDAYVLSHLNRYLYNAVLPFSSARFLHQLISKFKLLPDFLYHLLTTLRGARTLNEEYCDVVHVDSETGQLPRLSQRAGYILTRMLL